MNTNGTLVLYDSWIEHAVKVADLSADVFKMGLCSSTYVPSQSGHSQLSDITNELSGSGYTRQTLASSGVTRSGGTVKFDAADAVFNAVGGDLVARYFFIYDDTLSGDPLVCYGLIDNTPADITISDGNNLTLQFNLNGLFQFVRA